MWVECGCFLNMPFVDITLFGPRLSLMITKRSSFSHVRIGDATIANLGWLSIEWHRDG